MPTHLEYSRPEEKARASTGSHCVDIKLRSLDGHTCIAVVHQYLAANSLLRGLAASGHGRLAKELKM